MARGCQQASQSVGTLPKQGMPYRPLATSRAQPAGTTLQRVCSLAMAPQHTTAQHVSLLCTTSPSLARANALCQTSTAPQELCDSCSQSLALQQTLLLAAKNMHASPFQARLPAPRLPHHSKPDQQKPLTVLPYLRYAADDTKTKPGWLTAFYAAPLWKKAGKPPKKRHDRTYSLATPNNQR
jgi:hypothetical protein